jgi:hypothetical protein
MVLVDRLLSSLRRLMGMTALIACRGERGARLEASAGPHKALTSNWSVKSSLRPTPHDDAMLDRAHIQWQIGDWEGLGGIALEHIQDHPDRDILAMFAAAGLEQLGRPKEAGTLTRQALDWGCSPRLVGQILISGIHNSIGRAEAANGREREATSQFAAAIDAGAPNSDRLVVMTRTALQLSQLKAIKARISEPLEPEPQTSVNNHYDNDTERSPNNTVKTPPKLRSHQSKTAPYQIVELDPQNYFLPKNYKSRANYTHYDDRGETDNWQLEVYLYALAIMKRNRFKTVIDIGCGSGFKLIEYLGSFNTIGYELESNITHLRTLYPDRDWRISDFKCDTYEADLIICADVIEHLTDPDLLMRKLQSCPTANIILSTPDRNLVYSDTDTHNEGPPRNPAHTREWDWEGFELYMSRYLDIVEHRYSNIHQCTQLVHGIPKASELPPHRSQEHA